MSKPPLHPTIRVDAKTPYNLIDMAAFQDYGDHTGEEVIDLTDMGGGEAFLEDRNDSPMTEGPHYGSAVAAPEESVSESNSEGQPPQGSVDTDTAVRETEMETAPVPLTVDTQVFESRADEKSNGAVAETSDNGRPTVDATSPANSEGAVIRAFSNRITANGTEDSLAEDENDSAQTSPQSTVARFGSRFRKAMRMRERRRSPAKRRTSVDPVIDPPLTPDSQATSQAVATNHAHNHTHGDKIPPILQFYHLPVVSEVKTTADSESGQEEDYEVDPEGDTEESIQQTLTNDSASYPTVTGRFSDAGNFTTSATRQSVWTQQDWPTHDQPQLSPPVELTATKNEYQQASVSTSAVDETSQKSEKSAEDAEVKIAELRALRASKRQELLSFSPSIQTSNPPESTPVSARTISGPETNDTETRMAWIMALRAKRQSLLSAHSSESSTVQVSRPSETPVAQLKEEPVSVSQKTPRLDTTVQSSRPFDQVNYHSQVGKEARDVIRIPSQDQEDIIVMEPEGDTSFKDSSHHDIITITSSIEETICGSSVVSNKRFMSIEPMPESGPDLRVREISYTPTDVQEGVNVPWSAEAELYALRMDPMPSSYKRMDPPTMSDNEGLSSVEAVSSNDTSSEEEVGQNDDRNQTNVNNPIEVHDESFDLPLESGTKRTVVLERARALLATQAANRQLAKSKIRDSGEHTKETANHSIIDLIRMEEEMEEQPIWDEGVDSTEEKKDDDGAGSSIRNVTSAVSATTSEGIVVETVTEDLFRRDDVALTNEKADAVAKRVEGNQRFDDSPFEKIRKRLVRLDIEDFRSVVMVKGGKNEDGQCEKSLEILLDKEDDGVNGNYSRNLAMSECSSSEGAPYAEKKASGDNCDTPNSSDKKNYVGGEISGPTPSDELTIEGRSAKAAIDTAEESAQTREKSLTPFVVSEEPKRKNQEAEASQVVEGENTESEMSRQDTIEERTGKILDGLGGPPPLTFTETESVAEPAPALTLSTINEALIEPKHPSMPKSALKGHVRFIDQATTDLTESFVEARTIDLEDVSDGSEAHESVSKVSYLDTDESDLETAYESNTVPMIVRMLDQSCAWLEDNNTCGLEPQPSLFRESRVRPPLPIWHSGKTSNRRTKKQQAAQKDKSIVATSSPETPVVPLTKKAGSTTNQRTLLQKVSDQEKNIMGETDASKTNKSLEAPPKPTSPRRKAVRKARKEPKSTQKAKSILDLPMFRSGTNGNYKLTSSFLNKAADNSSVDTITENSSYDNPILVEAMDGVAKKKKSLSIETGINEIPAEKDGPKAVTNAPSQEVKASVPTRKFIEYKPKAEQAQPRQEVIDTMVDQFRHSRSKLEKGESTLSPRKRGLPPSPNVNRWSNIPTVVQNNSSSSSSELTNDMPEAILSFQDKLQQRMTRVRMIAPTFLEEEEAMQRREGCDPDEEISDPVVDEKDAGNNKSDEENVGPHRRTSSSETERLAALALAEKLRVRANRLKEKRRQRESSVPNLGITA